MRHITAFLVNIIVLLLIVGLVSLAMTAPTVKESIIVPENVHNKLATSNSFAPL
nr:unnamed protein product [Callosobruchus chinensis]